MVRANVDLGLMKERAIVLRVWLLLLTIFEVRQGTIHTTAAELTRLGCKQFPKPPARRAVSEAIKRLSDLGIIGTERKAGVTIISLPKDDQ